MPANSADLPWMSAWLEAERALAQLRPPNALAGGMASAEVMRSLLEFGRNYAGIAADFWRELQSAQPDLGALGGRLVERYQRLFMPVAVPATDASTATADAAFARCQRAAERFGRLAAAIAIDAFDRLSASLGKEDAGAPPITSLRELHALWIECGEAAYAAAAHREEFAEAQAELLASFVELRHEAQPR